jgi:predicted flap endonuclease-1-like 5' DNA nuclease
MFRLSKKRRSKESKLTFIDYICEMSRRADIAAIENSLKSFWKDRNANPWNKIYTTIEKYWMKKRPNEDITNTLLLIRDGVFGALDIHSMSLALDIPTKKLLDMLLSAKNWKEGRRKVRTHCSKLVSNMLAKGDTKYLVPSGLERDGFGFLVPSLRAARIKQFEKAQPKKSGNKLNLNKLADSVLGRELLRLHMITPEKTAKGKQRWALPIDDPRADELLEAYENMILDLEIDETSRIIPDYTQQVTLNGKPLSEEITPRKEYREYISAPGVQEPLTDYLSEKQDGEKKKKTVKKVTKKKKAIEKEPSAEHELAEIDGIGPALQKKLKDAGIMTVLQLSSASKEELASKVDGLGITSAEKFIAAAEKLVASQKKSRKKSKKKKTSQKRKKKPKKRKITKKKKTSNKKGDS